MYLPSFFELVGGTRDATADVCDVNIAGPGKKFHASLASLASLINRTAFFRLSSSNNHIATRGSPISGVFKFPLNPKYAPVMYLNFWRLFYVQSYGDTCIVIVVSQTERTWVSVVASSDDPVFGRGPNDT